MKLVTPSDDVLAEHREKKRVLALQKRYTKRAAKERADKRAKASAANLAEVNQNRAIEAETAKKVLEGETIKAPIAADPIRAELARRVLARRRLLEFVKSFNPRYKAGWVHARIAKALEAFSDAVAAGKSPRLMILMPPRHGKSELASRAFPAWHLGRFPHHEFIACSYNISLALDFSRKARDILRSPAYATLFPETKLHPDFQSAESWRLIGDGGYVAAGVGGGITGKGAHVLVIDDPIKNAEDADSAEHRQKVWEWYTSTAYTRLAPGGGVLLIQTCWNEDDMAGRLLEEMKKDPDADNWEVLRFPAIAEEDEEDRKKGEALHPARYPLGALERIRKTLSVRWWSALYQQAPTVELGAVFKKEWFKYRKGDEVIDQWNIYQAWDFAITEKKRSDWNVCVTLGQDEKDNLHVLDMRRFKTDDGEEICDTIIDCYLKWHGKGATLRVGLEDGQIWKSIKSTFMRRCTERKVFVSMEDPLVPISDKGARADPLKARMQHGAFFFTPGMEDLDILQRELLGFLGGARHDDTVDAAAWCTRIATNYPAPQSAKRKARGSQRTVQEILRELTAGRRSFMSG